MDIHPKKVLIIDDDEQMARVYEIKLGQEGIGALIAKTGEDGLQKMIAEKPQIVLLDLMLQKQDGFWVLEEMDKRPELKALPVIVLSNLSQKIDEERALSLGARYYMVKANVSLQEVVDKVKQFLD